MTMFRLPLVAVMVAAVVTVGGCAPDLGDSSAVEVAGSEGSESYLSQEVSWSECPADWFVDSGVASTATADALVDCTTIVVPGFYDDEVSTPDFRIAMMRVRVDESIDKAIFINPGGPGGSGIEQVQNSDFPSDILDEYAFIGFDPRGVGHSTFVDGTTIKCSDELDYLSYFGEASPANEAEVDAGVAENNAYYEDCVANNPYWWTLSTAGVVDDLEVMRALVTPGEPLNFIGSSYGTTIAGRFVSEYPDSVGKIVFDSPTTVDTDRISSRITDLAAAEEKLRIYVQGYADFLGISFEDAFDRVLEVRQRADDGELVGYAGYEPSPVVPQTMVSSEALFTRGIFTLNYFPEGQAVELFIQAMEDAYNENWAGIFEQAAFYLDGYEPDSLAGDSLEAKNLERSNEYEIRVIVNTMDFSLPPLTEEEQRDFSARFQEAAPLWFELSLDQTGYQYFGPPKGLDWYQLALADPMIPDPPAVPFIPDNSSGRNLLVVGSLFESVTPFDFAKDTAELLGATLISVDSDVHAPVAWYDNECINSVLSEYFLTDNPIPDTDC